MVFERKKRLNAQSSDYEDTISQRTLRPWWYQAESVMLTTGIAAYSGPLSQVGT